MNKTRLAEIKPKCLPKASDERVLKQENVFKTNEDVSDDTEEIEADGKISELTIRTKKKPTSLSEPEVSQILLKENDIETNDDPLELEVYEDVSEPNPSYKNEDREKHQDNLRAVLLCSNATPIKLQTDKGYGCEFCKQTYLNPTDLKRHILVTHDNDAKFKYMKEVEMYFFIVKLDITNLYCKLCNEDIDTIEDLLQHLKTVHGESVHTDIKRLLIPYKFEGDSLKCCVCGHGFSAFKALSQHMVAHYKNYQCETCSKWYLNRCALVRHKRTHRGGVFTCSLCTKVFDSKVNRMQHESIVHRLKNTRASCGVCKQRFKRLDQKIKHLSDVHGFPKRMYKCNACDKSLSCAKTLKRHMQNIHLIQRDYKCDVCEKEFYSKRNLDDHMLRHTNVKNYICMICGKGFKHNRAMSKHLESHSEQKQDATRRRLVLDYECDWCDRKYGKKKSLQRHIREKHLLT